MARICIVTPMPVGSNPRVVKEADALAAAGFDVRVVATKVLDLVEPRDQAILADARYPIERVAFNDRFVWLQERLRQAAWRKLFAAAAVPALAVRAYSPISRRLGHAAMAQPADLYIAHYVAALPVAAQAARKYGSAYAFDAEDFQLEDQAEGRRPVLEKRLIREIESRYLPGAAFVTAASPMIADAYANTYGIPRPTVVLNVFPSANAPSSPTARGTATPGPSLYWFSQTIGADRGLETAIEAIARAASAPHLYLRGTPASGYADTLRELARKYGVSDRLQLLAPEVPAELERLGAQYDLGYVGELSEIKNRQIALTNKLFSYLVGGLPTLASDIPAHRAIAPELGDAIRLFPIGDAMALAAELDSFLLNPERLASARAHAWQLGQQRYCWDVEQRKFLDVVESVTARPVAPCEVA
jgi:glycosyltransferase involved in cell wall biosynthesis